MSKYKYMSYDEFLDYCENNALYGTWSYEEAVICCSLIKEIEKIKIKKFKFFTDKKRTKRVKEILWEVIRDSFNIIY